MQAKKYIIRMLQNIVLRSQNQKPILFKDVIDSSNFLKRTNNQIPLLPNTNVARMMLKHINVMLPPSSSASLVYIFIQPISKSANTCMLVGDTLSHEFLIGVYDIKNFETQNIAFDNTLQQIIEIVNIIFLL